jgi:fused-like protein
MMLFAQVYRGRRKWTGQITAMKFIGKAGKSEKDIKNLRQEIEILRQLRHENIIQMLDAIETRTDFCVITGMPIAPADEQLSIIASNLLI